MIGPIIIPLDGSKLAEQAIALAYSIAQHTNHDVLLLQVVEKEVNPLPAQSDQAIGIDQLPDYATKQAKAYLQAIAEQLQLEGGPAISYDVVFGRPGEGIARVADEREASYVVMSTHGYTGFTRWMMGSVADRVLHLTERPLVLIRPPHHVAYDPLEQQMTELPEVKRLVVPLEGLPLAEQVLPYVEELAQAYGEADIVLFHTIAPFPAGLVPIQTEKLKRQWQALSHEDAQTYLGNLVSQLRAQGHTVQFAIRVGMPAEEILKYTKEVDADLIMMTTHARDGINRFLLGSVTSRVVKGGDVPVMVIRPTTGVV